MEVVTAGSPRVFNPAAAKWYNVQVQNNYRMVNNKDIVPSLPFAQMGYACCDRTWRLACTANFHCWVLACLYDALPFPEWRVLWRWHHLYP